MAYNIAANQRLATPVSSFQKGQALRLAEQQAEQDMRLASQQEQLNQIAIEQAGKPDPAEQRAADKAQRERAAELMTLGKDSAVRSLSIYQQTLESTGDEEAARAAAQEQSQRDKEFAVSIYGEELADQLDPDDTWTPEEARASIAEIDDVMGKAEIGDWTVFRDAKGNPVGTAQEGTKRYQELIDSGAFPGTEVGRPEQEAAGTGEAGDVRSRKISDLMAQGVSRDRAVNIVDGNIDIEIVPQTGTARLIDRVNNKVEEIPLGVLDSEEGEAIRAAPEPGRTLWDLAEFATGPLSAATATASVVSSIVGGPISEKVAQARQTLEFETTGLIRSLSINPRFPVAEIERIRTEVKLTPAVFDSPPLMRQRMISIDEGLRRRLAQAERDAMDPNLPRETRESQSANASAIRNFLPVLGVPKGTESEPVTIKGDEDYEALPSGAQFIGPDGKLRVKP